MDKTLKLYYARIRNMGDRLNELVLSDIFGYRVLRASCLDGEISAIGSGLDQFTLHGTAAMRIQQRIYGFFRPRVYVWGTGFINYAESDSPFFRRDMRFCAVRGELSRIRCEKLTGRTLDIPTGDGGILASMLIPEKIEKKHSVGIVPHVCDIGDPLVAKLAASSDGSVIIDVRDDPYAVLRQIASCETVLSSSLHGLIAADSFHIPNHHIIFSDRPLGDGFKFDDYYSAYGSEHKCTDLRVKAFGSVSDASALWSLTPAVIEEKKAQMLACFPHLP